MLEDRLHWKTNFLVYYLGKTKAQNHEEKIGKFQLLPKLIVFLCDKKQALQGNRLGKKFL